MHDHYIPNKKGWINDIISYIQNLYSSNDCIEIEERIALSMFAREELKKKEKKDCQDKNRVANEIIRKFNSIYHSQS